MPRIIKNTLLNYITTDFEIEQIINPARIFEFNNKPVKNGQIIYPLNTKNSAWKRQFLAEQQGVSEQYSVVVRSGVPLDFHDVFKRLRDGATFRVTGYARDSEAPAASTVQIAKVTAERWVIPA